MTISAKLIAYSKTFDGQTIAAFELEYPRFIHSEFMTHRLFSRNAASSRAIPVETLLTLVRTDPAMPIHWGQNQPGMQANSRLRYFRRKAAEKMWRIAAKSAARTAEALNRVGLHKQVTNRILEPFQNIKVVMTATCLDNFFWLRNHKDAQPEIEELARLMWEALQDATPVSLKTGWWHTPYFRDGFWKPVRNDSEFGLVDDDDNTLQDALAISSSCCAQVSYRKLDDTLEKALMIYQRLVESKPVHASPFEHQATPMKDYNWDAEENYRNSFETWEKGITHVDRNGEFWSGNFIGFIQHRQLLDDHTCWEYKG